MQQPHHAPICSSLQCMGTALVHDGAHPRSGCIHAHHEHVRDNYLQELHSMHHVHLQVADMPSASREDVVTAPAQAALVDVGNTRITANIASRHAPYCGQVQSNCASPGSFEKETKAHGLRYCWTMRLFKSM